VSEDSVQVIMVKLEHMESLISQIHEEVKRTNGRVTELEMESAEWRGRLESRRMFQMILTTVTSGCVLAGVVWFITNSIN
jgi:hypothetical protein